MVNLSIALLLIGLGYLVKHNQWDFLISGQNTSTEKKKESYNKPLLSKDIGHIIYMLAGSLVLSSFGEFFSADIVMVLGWILFSVITIGFIVYANTGDRYKRHIV